MNADCTILVASCDKYRDVERPFLAFFRRHWADTPFELVVAGESGAEAGFDRKILVGRGKTWSQILVAALDEIATPYVLLLMNDYWLSADVDTALVLKRLNEAKKADALNYRFIPEPPRAVKNTAYAVSCKAGIWNREFLRSIASRTASAWEFERRGSYMFDERDPRPLLVSERAEIPLVDAVRKGFYERAAIELAEREGVALDLAARTTPPLSRRVIEGAKALAFKTLPIELIVRLQNGWRRRERVARR